VIAGNAQEICVNMMQILDKENSQLTASLAHMRTLYNANTNKRGLINAIGTISKTLFGTMDAEDAQRINEQLQILQDNQQVLQHAAKHQLKILNATIGHISSLEKATAYNENLLLNVTKRMGMQLDKYTQREDLDEHLQILTAIMTDLTVDVCKTLDYLTYSKEGLIPTRLLPLDQIIADLREAASQLTKGLHFLFQIKVENWNVIQKYISINAFYSSSHIFTTLKFPVIAYSTYKIIRVTPLPHYSHSNVFTFVKSDYPLIAIDKENNHYTMLSEDDLNKCVRDTTTYMCGQTFPIYYIKSDAPCEVSIFINAPGQMQNCENGHVLSSTTLWITLTEAQTWLYSTRESQKVFVNCNNEENVLQINGTGRIKLNGDCKLTTPDLTLRTKSILNVQYIKEYLPEYNLTCHFEKDIDIDLSKRIPLKQLIKNPKELTELSLGTREVEEYLGKSNTHVFSNKYVMYPIGTGTVILIIINIYV
ncbi:hypothetical protein ALC57_01254, partial [Trachymyrmex cornetzi]